MKISNTLSALFAGAVALLQPTNARTLPPTTGSSSGFGPFNPFTFPTPAPTPPFIVTFPPRTLAPTTAVPTTQQPTSLPTTSVVPTPTTAQPTTSPTPSVVPTTANVIMTTTPPTVTPTTTPATSASPTPSMPSATPSMSTGSGSMTAGTPSPQSISNTPSNTGNTGLGASSGTAGNPSNIQYSNGSSSGGSGKTTIIAVASVLGVVVVGAVAFVVYRSAANSRDDDDEENWAPVTYPTDTPAAPAQAWNQNVNVVRPSEKEELRSVYGLEFGRSHASGEIEWGSNSKYNLPASAEVYTSPHLYPANEPTAKSSSVATSFAQNQRRTTDFGWGRVATKQELEMTNTVELDDDDDDDDLESVRSSFESKAGRYQDRRGSAVSLEL